MFYGLFFLVLMILKDNSFSYPDFVNFPSDRNENITIEILHNVYKIFYANEITDMIYELVSFSFRLSSKKGKQIWYNGKNILFRS